MNFTTTMLVHRLMDRTGMTYEEAYEELAHQADCEYDRRKDEALEREYEQTQRQTTSL